MIETIWNSVRARAMVTRMPSPAWLGLSLSYPAFKVWHPQFGWGQSTERFMDDVEVTWQYTGPVSCPFNELWVKNYE